MEKCNASVRLLNREFGVPAAGKTAGAVADTSAKVAPIAEAALL